MKVVMVVVVVVVIIGRLRGHDLCEALGGSFGGEVLSLLDVRDSGDGRGPDVMVGRGQCRRRRRQSGGAGFAAPLPRRRRRRRENRSIGSSPVHDDDDDDDDVQVRN